MAILNVLVTDKDYKYDSRPNPIITHGEAGFMCCFGPRGHVFGYKGAMYYCFVYNRNLIHMNTTPRQLKTTFSHGMFIHPEVPYPKHYLAVYYERQAITNTKRRRGRKLISDAYAHRATYLLIRAQRWYRRIMFQWRTRRLALAMSLQARLGTDSHLRELGPDLLALVLAC